MIRFTTLGALDLTHGDGRVADSILKRPKRLALLAYLATAGSGGLRSRDSVLGIFWPDYDQARARQALNQALYVLRSSLGHEIAVSVGSDQIGIGDGALWCDAAALHTTAEEGRHQEAVALYCGEFLPGFYLPDTPEFEKWLDVEREALRRSAAAAAWRLAEEAAERGDHVEAAGAAVRSVELARHDEASARRAIALLGALGDRARALSLYECFAQRLEAELETTPSAETQRMVAEMRAKPPDVGNVPESVAGAAAAAEEAGASTIPGAPTPPARIAAEAVAVQGAAAGTIAGDAPAAAPASAPAAGGTAEDDRHAEAAHAAPHPIRRRTVRKRRIGVLVGIAAVGILGTLVADRIGDGPSGATAEELLIAEGPPRIEVRPFEGAAGDGPLAGVPRALTSAIAGRLSEVDALEVAVAGPQTAAVESASAGAVAQPRQARFVVSGQVIADGDVTRLNLTLADEPTGQVIGYADIQRADMQPLAFVDEVAAAAADMVRARVGREMEERRWRAGTTDVDAWRLLERAEADRRQAMELRNRGALDAAAGALANADSLLALAEDEGDGWTQPIVLRARVAYDALWLALMSPELRADSALPRLRRGLAHAERALERHPDDPRALELKGLLLYWAPQLRPMDAPEAAKVLSGVEQTLRRAVQKDPNSVAGWLTLSAVLQARGEFGDSYYAARQASEADTFLDQPMEVLVRLFSGAFEAYDDSAARNACAEMLRRFPGSWIGFDCQLTLLAWGASVPEGVIDSAWNIAKQVPASHPARPRLDMLVANVIAAQGMADSARAVADRTRSASPGDPELLRYQAAMLGTLGMRDSGIKLLGKYIQQQPVRRLSAPRSRMLFSLGEPMRIEDR